MKLGLALCGGGAYGAYELGVYKFLKEEKIDFDIVTGTSIGALNGAMFASNNYDLASELWRNISAEKIFKDGFDIDENFLKHFSLNPKSKFQKVVKSYFKNFGVDIAPFKKLVKEAIGPIDFSKINTKVGIVTCKYPSLSEVDILLNDLNRNKAVDYLLASASCFPAFPIYKIGKEKYVDGGWKNNLPIDFCFNLGADKVMAIYLDSFPTAQKQEYFSLPNVTLIRPSRVVGKMLSFKKEDIESNIQIGYLDASKLLGNNKGYRYTFKSNKAMMEIANKHMSMLTKKGIKKALKSIDMLFKNVKWKLEKNSLNVFLLNLERVLEIYNIDYKKEYGIEQISRILFNAASIYIENKNDANDKEKLALNLLLWKQDINETKSEYSLLDEVLMNSIFD